MFHLEADLGFQVKWLKIFQRSLSLSVIQRFGVLELKALNL